LQLWEKAGRPRAGIWRRAKATLNSDNPYALELRRALLDAKLTIGTARAIARLSQYWHTRADVPLTLRGLRSGSPSLSRTAMNTELINGREPEKSEDDIQREQLGPVACAYPTKKVRRR
jgi:hypothetical protein